MARGANDTRSLSQIQLTHVPPLRVWAVALVVSVVALIYVITVDSVCHTERVEYCDWTYENGTLELMRMTRGGSCALNYYGYNETMAEEVGPALSVQMIGTTVYLGDGGCCQSNDLAYIAIIILLSCAIVICGVVIVHMYYETGTNVSVAVLDVCAHLDKAMQMGRHGRFTIHGMIPSELQCEVYYRYSELVIHYMDVSTVEVDVAWRYRSDDEHVTIGS